MFKSEVNKVSLRIKDSGCMHFYPIAGNKVLIDFDQEPLNGFGNDAYTLSFVEILKSFWRLF